MEAMSLCLPIHKRTGFFFSGLLRYILELFDAYGADKDDDLAEAALGERVEVLQASFCPPVS